MYAFLKTASIPGKPSKKVVEPDTFKYEFFGDTLAFFEVVGGETSEYGIMYVGGQGGELEGTWVYTDCEYKTYSKEGGIDE